MSNADPFEILAGPANIWLAPVGTAFPLIDAAPAVAWVQLAVAASLTEEGVRLIADQTVEHVYSLGGTGSRKGFRTRQELHARFTLMDATAEAMAKAMANQAVTAVVPGVGIPGQKSIPLAMPGGSIDTKAMLIRVPSSPYGVEASGDPAFNRQWEFPRVYNAGNLEVVYVKGVPVGIAFDFMVMDDNAGNKGTYRAQPAKAS